MEFSIDRLAQLARLQLSKQEEREFKNDLERIVAYVDQLREVDADGVAERTYTAPEINRLREDDPPDPTIIQAGLPRAHNEKEVAALRNAFPDLRNASPERVAGYARVPSVFTKSST